MNRWCFFFSTAVTIVIDGTSSYSGDVIMFKRFPPLTLFSSPKNQAFFIKDLLKRNKINVNFVKAGHWQQL